MAKAGIMHLGYPDYFRVFLNVMKVLGAIALVVPFVPKVVKEWAYAGFTFSLLAATFSHYMVDGLGPETFFPLVILSILGISYFSKSHKTETLG
jgi:hypothetical protein